MTSNDVIALIFLQADYVTVVEPLIGLKIDL